MTWEKVGIHAYPVGRTNEGFSVHQDFLDELAGSRHYSLVRAVKFMTETKAEALVLCMTHHPGDLIFVAQHVRFINDTITSQLPGAVQMHLTREFKWWVQRLPELVKTNAINSVNPITIEEDIIIARPNN